MCSITEVTRFTWSQRGQGIFPRPWLFNHPQHRLQASSVPQSQVKSHIPLPQPFSIACRCSNLWAFLSHNLILFSSVQLPNHLICEPSPKTLFKFLWTLESVHYLELSVKLIHIHSIRWISSDWLKLATLNLKEMEPICCVYKEKMLSCCYQWVLVYAVVLVRAEWLS